MMKRFIPNISMPSADLSRVDIEFSNMSEGRKELEESSRLQTEHAGKRSGIRIGDLSLEHGLVKL